jgi:hypothetical protein
MVDLQNNSKYLIVVQEKVYNSLGQVDHGSYAVEQWPNFETIVDPTDISKNVTPPTGAHQFKDFIAVDYSAGSYDAPTSITGDLNTDLICRSAGIPSATSYDLAPSVTQIGGAKDIMFLLNSQLTGGALVYNATPELQDSTIYVNNNKTINSYTIYIGYLTNREVKLLGSQPTGLTIGNLSRDNSFVTLESTLASRIDELSLLKPQSIFNNLLQDYLKPINLKGIYLKPYYADSYDKQGNPDTINNTDDSDICKYWGVGCDTTEITLEVSSEASDSAGKTFCDDISGGDSSITFNSETNAGTRTITSTLTEIEAKVGSFFEQLFFGGLGRTSFHDIAYYTLKLVFKATGGDSIVLTLPHVTVTPSTSFSNDTNASATKSVAIGATVGNINTPPPIKFVSTVPFSSTTPKANIVIDSANLDPATSLPALIGDIVKNSSDDTLAKITNIDTSSALVATILGADDIMVSTSLVARYIPGSGPSTSTSKFHLHFLKNYHGEPYDYNFTLVVQNITPDAKTGVIPYNYSVILNVDDDLFRDTCSSAEEYVYYEFALPAGDYRAIKYNRAGEVVGQQEFTLAEGEDKDVSTDWDPAYPLPGIPTLSGTDTGKKSKKAKKE